MTEHFPALMIIDRSWQMHFFNKETHPSTVAKDMDAFVKKHAIGIFF